MGAAGGWVVGGVVVIGLLVVAGLIALVVVLLRASSRQQARQVSEMRAYAAARGLGYTEVDRALPDRFTGVPFGRGSGRVARHVVGGDHAGRRFVAFEYLFSTGSGDDRRRHRYGVVAVALPTPVPRVELLPSSTSGTFLDAFRGGDHRVGDPTFDAAYRLFTDSPPFAADLFTPDLRAWLIAQRPPMLQLRGADLQLSANGPLGPAEIERRLAFATGFLDRVPEAVWRRAAGGPLT